MCDTPIGSTLVIDRTCNSCKVIIEDRELPIDLVVLNMHDFNVILGLNWLSRYHASTDCYEKKVNFHIPSQLEFKFDGGVEQTTPIVISALQAK